MANFNYYLNRQGSSGRQGVKGDKGEAGYSPYIDIKSNTPTEFIMTIHNETESFDTPNLIPTAIGEKVTEMDAVLTTHTEDIANLKLEDQNINTNITSLQSDLTNLSEEVNTLSGEVATNSVAITNIKNKDTAQDSAIAALKTRVGGTEESIEDLNHEYTVLGSEVSDLSFKKQNKLVQGDNITLTDNDDGTTTISASGGGGGGGSSDVTAAGDNRFTGDNTFTGKVNIAGGALTVDGLATLNQTTAQYLNAVNITSAGEINAVSIKANGLRSDDIQTTENKKYLTELDVDNQTIQVVNGKLHANLDELGNEVNNLSSRVTTNEADISAMKTGKQNKLTAGNNITLTDLTDGTVRIDATGGGGGTPENMMTIDTNQTVSGVKTFTNSVNIGISGLESRIITTNNSESGQRQDLSIVSSGDLALSTGDVAFTDDDGGSYVRQGKIIDGSGNIVLTQGNVTAGNNITITKTGKGIKISAANGGGLNDSVASDTSTYSSTKIEKLTNITSSDTSISVTKSDTGVDIVANKDLVTGYAFPSDKSVSLTLGASGTKYTAPANGYFACKLYSTATQNSLEIYSNLVAYSTGRPAANLALTVSVPVLKGQFCSIFYTNAKVSGNGYFKFIYAEGSESEAQ